MPASATPDRPPTVVQDMTNNFAPDKSVASFEAEVFGTTTPPPPEPVQVTPPAAQKPVTPAPSATPTSTNNTEQKPAEEPQKTESKLSDFDKLLKGESIIATPKPEVKPQDQQQPQNQNNDRQRNLEGFEEQTAKWLQRMPYDAYEYFSKQLREKITYENETKNKLKSYETEVQQLKSGRQQIPPSYYENPNAAYLLPEVASIQRDLQVAQSVENHWSEQLAVIEAGLHAKAAGQTFDKKWYTLSRDKDGDVIINAEHDVTPEARAYVIRAMTSAADALKEQQRNLNQVVSGFKEKHNNLINGIRQAEKQYLPLFEDEKAEEYKVYEQVKPKIDELGITKENPAYSMLAKSVAFNLILRDTIMRMLADNKRNTSITQDSQQAGPNMGHVSGVGSGNSGPAPVKLSDFDKLLR